MCSRRLRSSRKAIDAVQGVMDSLVMVVVPATGKPVPAPAPASVSRGCPQFYTFFFGPVGEEGHRGGAPKSWLHPHLPEWHHSWCQSAISSFLPLCSHKEKTTEQIPDHTHSKLHRASKADRISCAIFRPALERPLLPSPTSVKTLAPLRRGFAPIRHCPTSAPSLVRLKYSLA